MILLLIFSFANARSASASSSGLSSTNKIGRALIVAILLNRYREIERGALVDLGLRPDAATVPIDNALHSRQAHAGTGEFLGIVQTLERAKQFVRVRHVETGAVVPDKK